VKDYYTHIDLFKRSFNLLVENICPTNDKATTFI